MSATYRLPEELFREMLLLCQRAAPLEACGLVGGPDAHSATRLLPVKNSDEDAVSYSMAPEDILAAMRQLDGDSLLLNAIYHSHPASRAYPSATDIAQAHLPVVYLILSLAGPPVLKGYLIENGEVEEVEVIIEGGEACA